MSLFPETFSQGRLAPHKPKRDALFGLRRDTVRFRRLRVAPRSYSSRPAKRPPLLPRRAGQATWFATSSAGADADRAPAAPSSRLMADEKEHVGPRSKDRPAETIRATLHRRSESKCNRRL